MVNVTDGTHVYVRFSTFKFFFSHGIAPIKHLGDETDIQQKIRCINVSNQLSFIGYLKEAGADGSDLEPHPLPGRALKGEHISEKLERMAGIEPALSAWKAGVIPLYDTRTVSMIGDFFI